jgi:hypothetical protein
VLRHIHVKNLKGQLYSKGETIHKTTAKHKIFKIENNKQKEESKTRR